MPIYAYQCTACGHAFDQLQKLSDADPSDCPHCHLQNVLSRQLTAPQFRLKGGGWYETDFKSGSDQKRNLSQAETSEPEKKSAEVASETKSSENKPGEVKKIEPAPVTPTPAS
jgi:putative FmdB family regulatory protein